ncbi:MAG: glycosyl hydrolase [bacterium]|nr:glycosyl hydrolase [bacterium]
MNKNNLSLTVIAISLAFSFVLVSHASAANQFTNNKQGLINYLAGLPNKSDNRVISGSYVSAGGRGGIDTIQTVFDQTGIWVGILGMEYTKWNGIANYAQANPVLIDYWNNGGLVSITEHFYNPDPLYDGSKGVYGRTTYPFPAVYTPGNAIYTNFVSELDRIATGFKQLQDAGVVVIFRPLHEMNGGWFWWGSANQGDFINLWKFTYNYFTVTKGLNNIIWLYNPNYVYGALRGALYYYPGSQYVDLVGTDIYCDDPALCAGGYADLLTTNKPFILGEFGPKQNTCTSNCGYDYTRLINGIKQALPKSVGFIAWTGANFGMSINQNVLQLLNDPLVLNRGELGGGTAPPAPTPGSSTCSNLLNSSLAVPTSFAASFNWFTNAKELLMNVVCSGSTATANIGNGSNTQYIYKTGYVWQNGQWTSFNYSGSSMDSGGNWFIGSANRSLGTLDLTQKQSVLSYICDWNGTKWNCGCHDSSCTANYWNLQQFK